jgi:transposase
VTERNGVLLGLFLSPANLYDSMGLVLTLDAIPPVRGRRGRPRRRPGKLHADKGYDDARCRRDCRARGIKPRIARRGINSSQRLGRHRWVIERTLAWFARFRRLTLRHKRRQDIWTAFHSLAAALICHKTLNASF